MYLHMGQEATDPRVKADVDRKLKELQALEEIVTLREAIAAYQKRNGAFPESLALVRPFVRTGPGAARITFNERGLPVDPNGVPFYYDPKLGFVHTDLNSLQLPQGVLRGKPGE
jgi:hypothetical protein